MRTKDQLLLEQAYEQILKTSLIKEDPDQCNVGNDTWMDYDDGSGITFGFNNIGLKPFQADKQDDETPIAIFEGFDNPEYGMLLTNRQSHLDMVDKILAQLSLATQGTVTFLDTIEFPLDTKRLGIDQGYAYKNIGTFNKGDKIDMSDPVQRADKKVQAFFKVKSEKFESRPFTAPAGRAWVRQTDIKQAHNKKFDSVLSFWVDKEDVSPDHYQQLIAKLKLVPEKTLVEFVSDDMASTTLDKCLNGSHAPVYSKEEQKEREKRKAEALAKVHAAAAVGTKDKDVQELLDNRKKEMQQVDADLRAKGAKLSLADRQRMVASESIQQYMERLK